MMHARFKFLSTAGLLLVLLAAACSPIALPTAATGGTPAANGRTGDTSNQEGSPGSTIPQDGPIGTPGEGPLIDNTREFNPLITINGSGFSEGSEFVIEGQGFPADTTVRVFLGRPASLSAGGSQSSATPQAGQTAVPSGTRQPGESDYTARDPLVTTMTNDQGRFSVHTVMPAPIPQGVVVEGFAPLWAVTDDLQVTANTVIEVSGAPGAGGSVSGGGTGDNNAVDLGRLDFDFDTTVLSYLNQVTGGNFQGSDLSVTALEEVEWTDGCLELGGQGEMCTQQIVPGYRFAVDVDGQSYEVRSDRSGRTIRLYQENNR